MSGRQRATPRHKRPTLVASFVVLLVVTAVAFATTGVGYFATERAKGGSTVVGTVVDYRVDETADATVILVDVEVDNPTKRPVAVNSALVNGRVDGTVVAKGSTVVSETIPPEGSTTITVRLRPIVEDHAAVIAAAENGSMAFTGSAWAQIERYRFQLPIRMDGGDQQ